MQMYRIGSVSRMTGLSALLIRSWESRYDFLKPVRGLNGFREYSSADITLLRFLKSEVDRGIRIGELAFLTREELSRRAEEENTKDAPSGGSRATVVADLLDSLQPLDVTRFERRLNEAVSMVPFEQALSETLLPLQLKVGELWHDRRLSVAIEHFVTKQVQQRLFSAIHHLKVSELGPRVVIACPEGEYHEIAAMMVTYIAVLRGCRVFYLGADIPVKDLAGFCSSTKPALLALSLTNQFTKDEAENFSDILVSHLRPMVPIVLGGSGARGMRSVFERKNLEVLGDLGLLEGRLMGLSVKQASLR